MTTPKVEQKTPEAEQMPAVEAADDQAAAEQPSAESTVAEGVSQEVSTEAPAAKEQPPVVVPSEKSAEQRPTERPSFDPAAIAAMQQRVTALERERLEAQENQRDADELAQYRSGLQQEELSPNVIEGLVRRVGQVQAYRRRVAQEAAQVQQRNVDAYYAFAGKLLAAQDLAQDTGMAFKDLFALGTLGEMQQAAKAFKVERELAKEKQARVTPVKLPSATPGQSRPTITADNIDKLYLEGKVSGSLYRRFMETGEIRS